MLARRRSESQGHLEKAHHPPAAGTGAGNHFRHGALRGRAASTPQRSAVAPSRRRLPPGGAGHPLGGPTNAEGDSSGIAGATSTPTGGDSRQGNGASTASDPRGGRAPGDVDILIHVVDDVRGKRKDFTCKQSLVLSQMKYFEPYFAGLTSEDEVDISVHCDVGVFEWLVGYMEGTKNAASLDASGIVSVLISSEFLRMSQLVEECIELMGRSISQVVRLPLDLSCLSNDITRRLAALLADEELDAVRDRRDRLLGRLFAHKVELLLSEEGRSLRPCIHCGRILTAEQRERTLCPRAPNAIDFHGNVTAKHAVESDWDPAKYVKDCQKNLGYAWRDIYWRLWGQVQTLYCVRCNKYFVGSDLQNCLHHPATPVWHGERSLRGVYPCCGQSALRFGASVQDAGCKARNHVVSPATTSEGEATATGSTPTASPVLDKLLRHRQQVCVEFASRQADPLYQLPGYENEEERSSATAGKEGQAGKSGHSTTNEQALEPSEDQCEGGEQEEYQDDEDDEDAETSRRQARSEEGDDEDSSSASDGAVRLSRVLGCYGRTNDWYCFDPPPEHRHRMGPWSRRAATGEARAGGCPREAKRRVRRRAPLQARRADRGRGERGSQVSSKGGTCEDLEEVVPHLQGGRWPSPPPEGSPSFFNMPFPSGTSEKRKLILKMDVLREDDRRRMDSLAALLSRCRARKAQAQACDEPRRLPSKPQRKGGKPPRPRSAPRAVAA